MIKLTSRILVAAGTGLGLAAIVALPATANQLEDIRERGTLQVAIDLGNPPFAMMDGEFNPTGSEVESARLLAEDLGVELEFITVPTSGRIPYLVSGRADIALSTLSITAERLEVVDFSIPYGEIATIVGGPVDADISSYADLEGMSVAVTRGTVNDTELTNGTEGVPGVQIVRFEDDPTSSAAVTSGQFAIYATSQPLLTELIKANPGLDMEVKFVVQSQPLGVAIRQGEPELTEFINEWVRANLDNGKLLDIYESYHGVRLDPERLTAIDLPRN